MVEPLLEGDRLACVGVVEVVREDEAPVDLEHVELDHVDARLQRGVEGRAGVAGHDRVRALVTNPQDWHPGHQKVVRLSSPCPRALTLAPQRGHGRPARL
jgi:hypothetical protein